MRRNVATAALFCLWIAIPSLAHEFSTSYAEVHVDGSNVDIGMTIDVTALHNGPQIDTNMDGQTTVAELDASIEVLTSAMTDNYRVSLPDGDPAVAERTGYELVSSNIVRLELSYRFDREATDLNVFSSLDRITQDDHRHVLQIGEGNQVRYTVLSSDYPEVEIDYTMGIPVWVTLYEFAVLGIEHIFTGYDHLAFLVALLLATSTLKSLVKIVTAFTVGHSVTLALATLGVVAVPSRLIESLIALSIAYVAIENFLGRQMVHRWLVTFLFGLIHGFGFSNVLREFGLTSGRLAVSLFSFNAGVELGQIAFVAVVFPLLWFLGRFEWKEHVVSGASILVMCLGFYWLVQRAVFG